MSRLRAWLDATPLAAVGLAVMREATGRADPLEAIVPSRAPRLPAEARVGFWSLCAGAGTSTVAALVAQRCAAGGGPLVLVDLDRWAPALALRAGVEGATIVDALVQPGRERDLVSRWGDVPFLPGSPDLHRDFDATRVRASVERLAAGRALVADLGTGADALDPALIAGLSRLVVVSGARAAQLQATFCARRLLREAPCAVGLALVDVEPEDASRIAAHAEMPLLAAIPHDPFLARDEFAARAPTMRAIDALVRAL